MRRYVRALVVCMVFVFFSALYVISKLHTSEISVGVVGRTALSQRGQIGQEGRRRAEKTGPDDQHWYNRYIMRRRERAKAMQLAVVACGERLDETVNMIKSAVLFSRRALLFHIFADEQLFAGFRKSLETWPLPFRSKFNFTLYPITFPRENAWEWKKLFKPCASQRLFLPILLKDVDSLLYVDTDILFLRPVEDLWDLLTRFNSTQMAAMAPEHEEPRIAWYSRFARHPYYGKTGVNSGVMLMNMTRIREAHFKNDMTSVGLRWEELLMPLLQKYKLNITWGDQDLLNIIFHHNPEALFVFPCQWNYRPDNCIYGSNCATAEREGVFVLHGNRGVYHDDKQPAFRAVYEAVRKYSFGEDLVQSLLLPLEEELKKTTHTYCGRSHPLFTKRLAHTLTALPSPDRRAHSTRLPRSARNMPIVIGTGSTT